LLDAVHRGRLALVEQAGHFLASEINHRRGQIVAQRRQMRGGARRDAARNPAAIDHGDARTLQGKFIGRGNSGDTCANDGYIAFGVALQRCCVRGDRNLHPKRLAAPVD
jgi:hypothetical protein